MQNLLFFYPIRQDIDDRMMAIKCIKTLDERYYLYKSNNVALLQSLEFGSTFNPFRIKGDYENIVS